MASLICEVHLWCVREDAVFVRDTDFSSFKYYDKSQQKGQSEQRRPYAFDKMTYANGRGLTWFVEQNGKLSTHVVLNDATHLSKCTCDLKT